MKKLIFLIILLGLFFTSFSQEQEKKLKIGLVLSGGGAKGLAHIGVLKVIEQAGVKIDFVGGTSMGAIVGGLYASGYNADQIDSIFKVTNFDELLRDYIPRASKNFYEKKNDEIYAITLPFNKLQLGVPNAFSKGIYMYSLLNELTYGVRHVRDFNQLPIPFLCMATDIESGTEILLNKGYLPQAMLASATFPSLFSPVEIEGTLLVDGGVTNNYPVEEIKKLGADFIIGVDVQDDLKDRKSLKDATRILVQISNLQTMDKMKKKIDETDIYIKPDIKNYSVISFSSGDSIIKKGEEAAFSVYEKIKKLGSNYKRNPLRCVKDSLSIQNINTNKLDNYNRSYVIGKLGFKPGARITYANLKKGIDNLSATQNFSAINYTLESNDKNDDLKLDLVENPTKTLLKFGLHYDGLYKSGILVNLTQKKTFFKNDVTSLDVILGDNFRYNLDYYIDNGFYWSFGIKSRFNQFNRNVETSGDPDNIFGNAGLNALNVDFSDFSNQIYVQTVFKQKFNIGVGLELKHIKIESKTTQSGTSLFENTDYLNLFGYMKYDSFDNLFFPKKGWYFSGDVQSYLYSSRNSSNFERYSIAKADFGYALNFYKKATVLLQSEGGFAIGEQTVPFFDFVLGGYGFNRINNFRHFYGYDFLGLHGDSYVKGSVVFDYEVLKKNHLNFTANFANIGDNLFDTNDWLKKPKYTGYALGYGLETIIGPVEIKQSWSPENNEYFTWFSIGFWF